MICRKLLRKRLQEMPRRLSRIDGAQSRLTPILTRISADQESIVLLGDGIRLVQKLNLIGDKIVGNILQNIIAQAHLHRLVQKEHINLIVPSKLAEISRVRVGVNVARPVLDEEAQHRRAAGPAVHPDG